MKTKKYQILFFTLILAGLLTCVWISADRGFVNVEATDASGTASTEDMKVKPVWVDYDALWLKIDANGNEKVYYSDKSMKIWYEAKSVLEEGKTGTDGKEYYYIDISWLSSTKDSIIKLKGDKNEEVVSITFPARNSKFKAKYDKVTGEIVFENVSNKITKFEWRKATSYTWNEVAIDDAKNAKSPFRQEIEKLRISGASIYVRLPQTIKEGDINTGTDATAEFDPGDRQSKEVKISITKRATAPKVTIDGTKLLLNTKATMEYSTNNGETWYDAEAKMPIANIKNIASDVLYFYNADGIITSMPTKSANILIRTKETSKKAYSKSFLLTIPMQRVWPTTAPLTSPTASTAADVGYTSDASKFYMNFTKASKTEPYEYLVVKPGITAPDLTKGWKAVTAAKTISLSSKTVPQGSAIYIRKKTVKANTKTNTAFELASAYTIIRANYAAPTTNSN